MSAVAGLWSFDSRIRVDESCKLMLDALSLYGRDHRTQYSSNQLAIGCCLLRLLPEDRFDRQPLSAHGVTALVADLRLDNREELTSKLNIGSLDAANMADSEILLAAWLKWREQCVDHLTGAFSFAVWMEAEQRLFLARDHTGERPLFYSFGADFFAFASMPKGLHPLDFVGAKIDEDYVARYLALVSTPVEQTIFHRIHRVPAGSALSIRRGEKKLWRYWQTDQLEPLRLKSDEAYLERFRESFDAAVWSRLRTIGGVGSQLSGGLDSSSVAATAAGLLGQQGRELYAYTAIPRPDFAAPNGRNFILNEGPAAAEVASLYPNMRHRLVRSCGSNFLDVIDFNNQLYDHPCYGPMNEVWSNAVLSRAKQDGVTVLLNGNCGNSTLSYYGLPAMCVWLRSGRWLTLAKAASEITKTGDATVKMLIRNALWPVLPFWLQRLTNPHMRSFTLDYSMLRPEISQRMDLELKALHELNDTVGDGRRMLTKLVKYGDISETTIAPQGGWQMDFRDPTFDKRVVEFCLTVPLEQFLRHGRLRSLARRSMVGRLPPSTLDRTQRGRQSADWYVSMGLVRGRMLQEIAMLRRSPLASRLLDLNRMQHLIEHWPTGGFDLPAVQSSYHIGLTRGLSVGRFLRQYDPDFHPAG